jgi:hypothetical protein
MFRVFFFAILFASLTVVADFPQTDFSVSSFLDICKPDPFSQLWEKIYKFSKENNETRRWLVYEKTEYFTKTPKEEWLPLLEKILVQDDLSDTVENWLRFSNTYMSSITNESVRLELKEKLKADCEKEGHYSFEKFTSALVNAEVNEKCLVPNSTAEILSLSRAADEIIYSITFYNLADALVYLDLTNELPKVAERVMKSLDKPADSNEDTLLDRILSHNPAGARHFCETYGCLPVFLKYRPNPRPDSK